MIFDIFGDFQKNKYSFGYGDFSGYFFGLNLHWNFFWGYFKKNQQFFWVLKISGIGLYVCSKYDILDNAISKQTYSIALVFVSLYLKVILL